MDQQQLKNYPPPASVADAKLEQNKNTNSVSNSPQKQNNNNSNSNNNTIQLTQQQQQLMLQVCQQTNCNHQTAYNALTQSNWNGNMAINRIKNS